MIVLKLTKGKVSLLSRKHIFGKPQWGDKIDLQPF